MTRTASVRRTRLSAKATQISEGQVANRLSTIVTRTGDDGTTGLGDGTRVSKHGLRITTIGEVDELNSHIGLLLSEVSMPHIRQDLVDIQHDLFDLGAQLCVPGQTRLAAQRVARLDERLAHYNASLPRLAEFILPGGTRSAAQAHICRTVCRRAERACVTLSRAETIPPEAVTYLNRLSDALFVWGRWASYVMGVGETLWEPNRSASGQQL